ncbi:deaminase [Comamonas antarctica]|uniref:deoxycytidylate deaminase n=1 Tax=Comamonas antarctica TaxID=2743470 RepID=UPI0028E51DBB|nr:deaminase [Comamonas antarctica]
MIDSTDKKFLATAMALAEIWGKDPSTRVAAVAVGHTKNRVAFGYNGFPPGVADTEARLHDRDVKLALTLHAEVNALANATFAVRTLYVTHHPCAHCALHILAARSMRRVVYLEQPGFDKRWGASMAEARMVLAEGGVEVEGCTL